MLKSIGNTKVLLVGFLGCALVLSACNPNKKPAGPPIVNGKWASSDGVYTAEFLNGSFSATANDTGGLISQGEYLALAEKRIQIRWNGLISGKSNQAECTREDPNQLECVDQNGNRFTLRRISGSTG